MQKTEFQKQFEHSIYSLNNFLVYISAIFVIFGIYIYSEIVINKSISYALQISDVILLILFPFFLEMWSSFRRKLEYLSYEITNLRARMFQKQWRLASLILTDVTNKWVNPKEIMTIKYYIQSTTIEVQNYLDSIRKLRKLKKYCIVFWHPIQFVQSINNLAKEIESEVCEYIKSYSLSIQSWISHHSTELAELERQIESQELSTENTGWKAALEISRMSLQEHLKELEKVRV